MVDKEASAECFISRWQEIVVIYLMKKFFQRILFFMRHWGIKWAKSIKDQWRTYQRGIKTENLWTAFLDREKVTKISDKYLIKNGYDKDIELSGIDNEFHSNLKSHIDFEDYDNLSDEEVEQIILRITVFEDKQLLKDYLNREFVKLSEDERKQICSLSYKGWGNLSEMLLNGITVTDSNGVEVSVMDMLWNTNLNLMQILSKEYGYKAEIEHYNKETWTKIIYNREDWWII